MEGAPQHMAFNPNELENITFRTVRRGLDPAEVRSYLVSVAATMRRDERTTNATPSTDGARNDAKAILLAAQETAESIRAEARRHAAQIREQAATKTQMIGNEAPVAAAASTAELRLQSKVRQLEALRAEVERLHVESGKAVRIASDERRAAELVRAESIDEISRLRRELNALQSQAGGAAVATTGMRVQVPGAIDPESPTLDTSAISVIDASDPTPPSPLVDAVKSAVGRAMKH